jgi:hypothetical protein
VGTSAAGVEGAEGNSAAPVARPSADAEMSRLGGAEGSFMAGYAFMNRSMFASRFGSEVQFRRWVVVL